MKAIKYNWRKISRPLKPDFFMGSLEYVIAVPEDLELILEFIIEEYHPRQELNRAIGLTVDLAIPGYRRILNQILKQPYSIIGFQDNVLVAASMCTIKEYPRNPERYKPYIWEIKSDYGEEIKEYHDDKNFLLSFYFNQLESDIDQIVPDCKRLLNGEMVCVKSDISNMGISTEIMELSLKWAIYNDCDYTMGTSTSKTALRVSEKNGCTAVKEFPPYKFIVNGKKVFNCGPNDEACGVLSIKKLQFDHAKLRCKI
uniref:N-acetyltransferase domain-containing protein n=1 Tax=Acrobeloides nanus TaxID=290746 RepID=A0A914BZN4_9BILA